ncbi:Multidrug transporter activation protein [uncultured Clostridium sp.]|nr:Multidrug transporter activation protein [uncultured Clostridium sp.]
MEYTINNLSKLAGVSTRTLRYYDEIGLLKPKRISSSGYRIYGEEEVNLLQQILFYKELDLPLEKIKSVIHSEEFDCVEALHEHKKNLLERQKQIEKLLNNIDRTLLSLKGEEEMSNKEKFEGFKKDIIKKNEEKYGKEIREKYGDKRVNKSNKKFAGLSEEEYNESERIRIEINEKLLEAMKINDPSNELAMEVVRLHKKWLEYFGTYPPQAHLNLGQIYVDDPRFTKYYDENVKQGAAKFLSMSIGAFYNAIFNENTWQWVIQDK